jgi:ribosomal protein S18 acetylase RimI-like enzyme
MDKDAAAQIAFLLNSQNQLNVQYTSETILENKKRYIVHYGEHKTVLGVVEVKRVQWYQCEISHVSVEPKAKRQGIGTSLLKKAETQAISLGARIAQATIRMGNEESEGLFKKHGYTATVTFLYRPGGNRVSVYQKVLI